MKKSEIISALALGALLAWTAASLNAQSSRTKSFDDPSERSSALSAATNQFNSATNAFGDATNKWGSSSNLPPTSTNNLPRIYGTNSSSGKSTNSAPLNDDIPK